MTEETNDTPQNINEPEMETPQIFEQVEPSIGELLRSKREQRDMTLKNISQQTKIHVGLLEHLEKDELTKLPSKTYVRGFVKSAAKILGINQEVALSALENTYNRQNKNEKKQSPSYEMRNETARNTLTSMAGTPLETVKSVTAYSTHFLAKVFVALLFIGVIGFNIKNLFEKTVDDHLKLPEVFTTNPQRTKAAPKPVAPKPIEKTAQEQLDLNSPIQVNIIQNKKDLNQKTELKINDVSLKTISPVEKQFTEDNSLPAEKLEEIFPSRYKVQVVKGTENVYINAVDGDSWITYKIDDKDIKKYVLRQGRSVFLRGEKIRLFIGNTKLIKIFYNNKLISLSGKSAIKNLVFPEVMKSKFMSPLFVFQKDGTVLTSEEFIKLNQKTTPLSTPLATPKVEQIPTSSPGNPINKI